MEQKESAKYPIPSVFLLFQTINQAKDIVIIELLVQSIMRKQA